MTEFEISSTGKYIAGDCVEIWLEDGIIRVVYLDHADITVAINKKMHEIYLHIAQEKKYPFLFSASGSIWFSKDARDFASEIETKQPFLAVAIYAPGLGYRLMAEFYARFNKPATPYKIFKDTAEAMQWLKTF